MLPVKLLDCMTPYLTINNIRFHIEMVSMTIRSGQCSTIGSSLSQFFAGSTTFQAITAAWNLVEGLDLFSGEGHYNTANNLKTWSNYIVCNVEKEPYKDNRSFLHFKVDLNPSFATFVPSISSKNAKFTAFIISIFLLLLSEWILV